MYNKENSLNKDSVLAEVNCLSFVNNLVDYWLQEKGHFEYITDKNLRFELPKTQKTNILKVINKYVKTRYFLLCQSPLQLDYYLKCLKKIGENTGDSEFYEKSKYIMNYVYRHKLNRYLKAKNNHKHLPNTYLTVDLIALLTKYDKQKIDKNKLFKTLRTMDVQYYRGHDSYLNSKIKNDMYKYLIKYFRKEGYGKHAVRN